MEGAIRPIRTLAAIVALDGQKNKFYIFRIGLFLLLVIIAAVMRQICEPVSSTKGFIITFVEFANYNLRLPTTFCCLVVTSQKRNDIEDFITSATLLDKKFNSMGFPGDYTYIRRLVRKLVGLVIFKTVAQQVPFCMKGFNWKMTDYFDYIVDNIPLIIINVLITQRVIYLTLTRVHFKTLNTILRTIRCGQCWMAEDFRPCMSKMANRQRDSIRKCGTIYDILSSQTHKINTAFAIQILCLIPTLFILIIYNSFQTFRMVKNQTGTFNTIWVVYDVLYFVIFLELVIPCLAVQEESEKVVDILHKISDNGVDDAVNSLILQTYHQTIEFNACGVFPLDGTLIYTVLGSLTTYIVILLQFDL